MKHWQVYRKVGLPPLLLLSRKVCPAGHVPLFFLYSCPPYLEFFNPNTHTLSHCIHSFTYAFTLHLLSPNDVTDNIPEVLEIRWWAKIDKIHALVNLHLQVKCG